MLGERAFRAQNAANLSERVGAELAYECVIPAAFNGVEHQITQKFGLRQEVSATPGL